NGEPRVGDLYGNGYVRLPVALREGMNDFVFAAGRAPIKTQFLEPKPAVELDTGDVTAPDFRVGVPIDASAALLVRNCTTEPAGDLQLEAPIGEQKPALTDVPAMLPASLRKVGFRIVGEAPDKAGPVAVRVRLLRKGKPEPLDTAQLMLQAVAPE